MKKADYYIKRVLLILLGIGFAVLCTLPWILWRTEIQAHTTAGYLGLFVTCLAMNLTVFLPNSSLLVTVMAATVLNPYLCVAVGAFGALLGEIGGYLVGLCAGGVLNGSKLFNRLNLFFEKHAFGAVLLFALLPLPIFDIVGFLAGSSKMPLWIFLIAGFAGKLLRYAIVVLGALVLLPLVAHLIPENILPYVNTVLTHLQLSTL